MTDDEWHGHFDKMMTQLGEARDRLKTVPLDSKEFHHVRQEVRAIMHELDCLTNPSLTPVEGDPAAGN